MLEAHSKEVGSGSSATLSCVVSDISEAVSITWKSSDGSVVDKSGITTSSGEFDGTFQTATLTIESAENEETFACEAKSIKYPDIDPVTKTVQVFVYSKFRLLTEMTILNFSFYFINLMHVTFTV